MATMFMGYHYNEGKKVGYNLTAPELKGSLGLYITNVSYKDKGRIKLEMAKSRGCDVSDIEEEREVNDWYKS